MNNCIESFSRNGILFIYIYSRQMHRRKKKISPTMKLLEQSCLTETLSFYAK